MSFQTQLPPATLVMTFHDEGVYAQRSLLGFLRVREYTHSYGGELYLICMLDCADELTTTIVKNFISKYGHVKDQVIEVAYGSLSASRNVGFDSVFTEYAGCLNGDDFFSANWVVNALHKIINKKNQQILCFPSQVISFGKHISNQTIQSDNLIPKTQNINIHYWISASFGHISIFRNNPYNEMIGKANKFSFEDWDFNIRCIASGVLLEPVENTYFFYRRRENSMLAEHTQMHSFVPPSKFFTYENLNL